MAGEASGSPRRLLTATEALGLLGLIDKAIEAVCATAPRTVALLGGRSQIRACSQMTCVGPVPRLRTAAWEEMSAEHADRQRYSPLG